MDWSKSPGFIKTAVHGDLSFDDILGANLSPGK